MQQMNIFDFLPPQSNGLFKIDKPIRLIELFAGVGSQAKALKRLGADFEHYRVCEFDKYAINSYNAVHGTNFDKSDIRHITAKDLGIVNTDKYCYIMTYSFPCQDLSLAGKQKGMAKGGNTRSSLLWEVERLLNECEVLPQVLLMENVPQVHGAKNKVHFDEWIRFLENKGYSNYWKDLNSKGFGIPQNRDRTFMVSILGKGLYVFPQEFTLELRLKDMLEDSVDEKYYLSNTAVNRLFTTTFVQSNFEHRAMQKQGLCCTLCARDYKDPICVVEEPTQIKILGNYSPSNHDASRIVDADYIAPTVKENHGTVTAIAEPLAYDEQNGYIRNDGTVGTLTTDGSSPKHNNRVVVWDGLNQRIRAEQSCVGTLTQNCGADLKRNGQGIIELNNKIKIRKLTPKECWRLMGFDDEDFHKAEKVNSNTQLYKQAGNSIVVNVLEHIFKAML